jgi:hypothetical protein
MMKNNLNYSSPAIIRPAAARILLARLLEIVEAAADDEVGVAVVVAEAGTDPPEVVMCVEPEIVVDLGVDELADCSRLAFSSKEVIIDW